MFAVLCEHIEFSNKTIGGDTYRVHIYEIPLIKYTYYYGKFLEN